MIPYTVIRPLSGGLQQPVPHPNSSALSQNSMHASTFSFSQPLSTPPPPDPPSIPSHHSIHQRMHSQSPMRNIPPDHSSMRALFRPPSQVMQSPRNSQRQVHQVKTEAEHKSTGLFDIEKEELKDEVKRLQGLLRKNEFEIEGVRRELASKNQILIDYQGRMSSGESHKTITTSQITALQQENLRLTAIIDRMRVDRETLVKGHEKYVRSDEAARVEIFGEVQKLQKLVQQKTKELQESKQRQIIISKLFQGFKSQAGNQLSEGERNTVHLMQKLKVALEGKELQIESLSQALKQLDTNLSESERVNSDSISRIRSLETQILSLQAENSNLKEYQSHKHHEVTLEATQQLSLLRSQVVDLQRQLETHRDREKEAMSTYAGISDKDQQLKMKLALQDAESNQLAMQYLSKQIHNYRLIVQDLESHKENGYRKDIEITRLHQQIITKEKQLVELEGVIEELRGKVKSLERNSHTTHERSEETIRKLEEKCMVLDGKIEVLEAEKVGLAEVGAVQADIQISELTKALDLSRNEYFALRKTSDQKIFGLETVKADFETQIRSLSLSVDQKETERGFFQNQYKILYSEFLETKKSGEVDHSNNQEIKELKSRLYQSEQEYQRVESQLVRVLEDGKERRGRSTFNTGQELSRARGIINSHSNQKRHKQHHRQSQSISGLKQENEHLKQLLQDAQNKIEDYASDLDGCQQRMGMFQDRMENLLAGGNGRQSANVQEYVQEQRQVIQQVQEFKEKLRVVRRENEQLKRKMREVKEESKKVRKESKSLNKESEKKRVEEERLRKREEKAEKAELERERLRMKEEKDEVQREREGMEKRVEGMSLELDDRHRKIQLLTEVNEQLHSQLTQVQGAHAQDQGTVKEYQRNIAQYQKAINQYEARIKQYQNHMLKIKNKYKQQAHMRLPQPQIQRPVNSLHTTSERVQFFRAKSQESEQRVKHLLKINHQLKTQLNQASQLMGGENLNTHNIQLLQSTIEALQRKLIASAQENIELKARIETVDDNPNLSTILEVKMRQLMEENSELRVQISQSHSEIFTLKQEAQGQASSKNQELNGEKFRYLEQKFEGLNQMIYSLESEKYELQNKNNQLRLSLGKQNSAQSQNLLQQVHDLQQELHRIKAAKHELQVELKDLRESNSATQPQTAVSMQTYTILMIQVDKLIQFSDGLHITFSNIIDVIAETSSEELKLAVDGFTIEAGEIFKGIEEVKSSLGGLRQQSEQAIMIHEMNQII